MLITVLSFTPPLTLFDQLADIVGAEQHKEGGNLGSDSMFDTA